MVRSRVWVGALGALMAVGLVAVPSGSDASAPSRVHRQPPPDGFRASQGLGPAHRLGFAVSHAVVDDRRGHIYLAAGAHGVVVTDEQGNVVRRLTALGRVGPEVLDPATGTVYVGGADEIDAIDGATLETRTLASGTGCESQLALSGATLLYSCRSDVYAVDIASGGISSSLAHQRSSITGLATSPGRPGWVYVEDSDVTAFTLSTTGPSMLTERARLTGRGRAGQIALSPDGSELVGLVAVGQYPDFSMLDPTTLEPTGVLAGGGGSDLSFRSDGWLVTGQDDHLSVYQPHQRAAFRIYSRDDGRDHLQAQTWAGSRLVTVFTRVSGAGTALYAVRPLREQRLTARIQGGTGSHVADHNVRVLLTLRTTASDRHVTITAITGATGARRVVDRLVVPAHGATEAHFMLAHSGRLVVSTASPTGYERTAGVIHIQIKAHLTTTFLNARRFEGPLAIFKPGDTARVVTVLSPAQPGCVTFYAEYWDVDHYYQPYGHTGCIPLVHGRAVATLRSTRRFNGASFMIRPVFTGSPLNSRGAGPWREFEFYSG